jgi:hypothetical protein
MLAPASSGAQIKLEDEDTRKVAIVHVKSEDSGAMEIQKWASGRRNIFSAQDQVHLNDDDLQRPGTANDVSMEVDPETAHASTPSLNLESTGTADNGRVVATPMSVLDQWEVISNTPELLRFWHLFVACSEATVTLTVYVYAWRRAGVPLGMVLPCLTFAIIDLTLAASYWFLGPLVSNVTISRVTGPVQGALAIYTMAVPLYLPMDKVCHSS